ncbi:MAG: hypothetical protein ACOCZR_02530 [Halanaerobiales bacterium]
MQGMMGRSSRGRHQGPGMMRNKVENDEENKNSIEGIEVPQDLLSEEDRIKEVLAGNEVKFRGDSPY